MKGQCYLAALDAAEAAAARKRAADRRKGRDIARASARSIAASAQIGNG